MSQIKSMLVPALVLPLALAALYPFSAVAGTQPLGATTRADGGRSEAVLDGGFESGTPNPYWQEYSNYRGTPIGDYVAHSGMWSCLFGDASTSYENSWVKQQVQLGNNTAVLAFFLYIPSRSFNGQDVLRVSVDNQVLLTVHEADAGGYGQYRLVTLNLSSFANGGFHVITFESETWGYAVGRQSLTAFYVDDVTISTTSQGLEANFSWTPQNPGIGELVQFTDLSLGDPTYWEWNFGNNRYSYDQNPTTRYPDDGLWTVTLTVRRGEVEDSMSQTVHVVSSVQADFTWSPESPTAGELVQFQDLSAGGATAWQWDFGDGGTASAQNPSHIFLEPGTYTVALTISGAAAEDTVEKVVEVAEAPPSVDFDISDFNPAIGQLVGFEITGIDTIDSASWDFGGSGCAGYSQAVTCSGEESDCHAATYRYATAGAKTVSLSVVSNGVSLQPVYRALDVADTGSCGEVPASSFTWWPQVPKKGEMVRFADTSTGNPNAWDWSFGDGATSAQRHPRHSFAAGGVYQVSLTASGEDGVGIPATRELTVLPTGATCGDGTCDEGESEWGCPADCALPAGETGRTGRAWPTLFLPAAVGGVAGNAGTYWLTEGMIFNPNDTAAMCLVEFTPDEAKAEVQVAGPVMLQPERALYLANLVHDLFGTTVNGSVWIDANRPLMLDTRTYNQTADGTFGQAIGGIRSSAVLSSGEGRVYLIGLSENAAFRTYLVVQEVSGSTVQVRVRVRRPDHSLVGEATFSVAGHSKVQRRLRELGFPNLRNGYVELEVVAGAGRVAALASVVDQKTGDATTIDAIHPTQVYQGGTAKDDENAGHFLVAVVARTPGDHDTLWRSSVTILNPFNSGQDLRLVYYPKGGGGPFTSRTHLDPGQLFHSDDIIDEQFPTAGDGIGALHIYSDEGVAVDSRTYNQLPDDAGTTGQSLPGLGAGDMARHDELWILNKLKRSNDFRCNMGFAEYSGDPAQVTIILFDVSGNGRRLLNAKTYEVAPFSNLQVNGVFENMGLYGTYQEALAYASVVSSKGAVYVYASIIDNAKGDATTVLAKQY